MRVPPAICLVMPVGRVPWRQALIGVFIAGPARGRADPVKRGRGAGKSFRCNANIFPAANDRESASGCFQWPRIVARRVLRQQCVIAFRRSSQQHLTASATHSGSDGSLARTDLRWPSISQTKEHK